MFVVPLIILIFIPSNHAHTVQANKPINQSCLNLGHVNDCRFYSCFEERFPCGLSYWMLKWGYKYCTRMQKSFVNFDKNGQQLIKQISTCLTSKLVKHRFYTLNSVNCEQLRLAGQRIVHECYINNAKLFCDAFQSKNRNCFIQLIDDEDRHDLTIIRTLSAVGQKCTPKIKIFNMRPVGNVNQCIQSPTA